jgi:hypothetical protein
MHVSLPHHPMDRFERPLFGEGLLCSYAIVDRIFARKLRELAPAIEVAEFMDVRWDSRRKSKRIVKAEPNAPLLIRLVRYPFTMKASPLIHLPLPERESLPERQPYGAVARDNADAWAKPSPHRPAKGRLRMTSPSRLSGDKWCNTEAKQ